MDKLKQQRAKEILKPVQKVRVFREVSLNRPYWTFSIDIMDLGNLKEYNDGYRYILNCIDIFTKYAFAVPMKSKKSNVVLDAFKKIIASSAEPPKKLWIDQGSEFLNKDFQDYLKSIGSVSYHTYGDHKANVIERFNRTLGERIEMYLESELTNKWVDKLDDIIEDYNNTKHRTIGITPTEALTNSAKVYKKLAKRKEAVKKRLFKVGDVVRIAKKKATFGKGKTGRWSEELFKVSALVEWPGQPFMYRLRDLNDEAIEGSFYNEELQLSEIPIGTQFKMV